MAQMEQYENLPGVKVSYEDGNLMTGDQAASSATQSILIIGTATDGPEGEPVSVNAVGGPKAAENMFGGLLERTVVEENGEEVSVKTPHQGTLVRAMWEAIRSGNEDVRLLRVSGKTAKTEIHAKDPNAEVTQPLEDSTGNQLIPGNVAFSAALNLPDNHRLINIERVEEYEGTNVSENPIKTYEGNTGYQSVDDTVGSETVYFAKDVFRPKNTIQVHYKASNRTYTEVTRSEDGVSDPSTKGLLTQDPNMSNYFSSEVGNWSDDPLHQVNVYVIDGDGNVNTIPSTNLNGERLWRIGKEDSSVTNELTDPITSQEFSQGGVRFTSAYQAEVTSGAYPALTSGVTVKADYFHYSDVQVAEYAEASVPGTEKVTTLKYMPESGSLEVYYEQNGQKTTLTESEDYTITYPSASGEKVEVRIQAGVGPVGARLYAEYKTGENSIEGAKLIVNALNPGKIYGGIDDPNNLDTLYGVKVVVEYEVNENGTIDMENRVIRFLKPEEKKSSSSDVELRFRTKNLRGIRTLREFANYVNGLPNNNIVNLEVPLEAGEVPVVGLIPTDYVISSVTGAYDYRPINLGEIYNEDAGSYELYVDSSKSENDPERFPWLGDNGFYDSTSLKDTKALYEKLGGKYQLIEGTLDEFDLVEQGVYSKLENYRTDIIWLAEVHANNIVGEEASDGSLVVSSNKNFATQLAQHCAMVTAKTYETIGVIGVAPSPQATLREVQDYIDLLTAGVGLTEEQEAFYLSRGINPSYDNRHFMYNLATHDQVFSDEGEPIDIGRYVSVVFGPEVGMAHEKLGNYVSNGAGLYAALISQLEIENAPTNKAISASGIRYSLSEAQHNQLAGGRFVTFERKIGTGGVTSVFVKDGVTGATPNSDYQRLSTVRITHGTVQLIRQRADKFIGLPNGIAQRNSLATEVQAALDRLKELGVLQNFNFSIYSSAKDRVLGNAFIQLELVPAFEMRKIYTSVALRASL